MIALSSVQKIHIVSCNQLHTAPIFPQAIFFSSLIIPLIAYAIRIKLDAPNVTRETVNVEEGGPASKGCKSINRHQNSGVCLRNLAKRVSAFLLWMFERKLRASRSWHKLDLISYHDWFCVPVHNIYQRLLIYIFTKWKKKPNYNFIHWQIQNTEFSNILCEFRN